jgi:hypothetical protein
LSSDPACGLLGAGGVWGRERAEWYARPMSAEELTAAEKFRVGLCADCAHARRIESRKGSVFYMCERSAREPEYAKYPRLPVIQCGGYEKKI